MRNPSKKNILITGVSGGIGWTIARNLSVDFNIIGTIRQNEQLERLSQELPDVECIVMDLEDPFSIQKGFDELLRQDPGFRLFALINNAGIACPGALLDLPMEQWRKQFEVNVFGLVQVIQLSIPLLIPSEGRIVNMSSVSGLFSSPFLGAYAASKFALEGLTDALRRELALMDLKVILIEPGPLKTSIWRKSLGLKDKYPKSLFNDYLQQSDELILQMESKALAVEKIITPIRHALKHKRPKIRYLVHRSPLLLRLIVHFIPTSWIDRLVLKNLRSKNTKIRPI